MTEKILAAHERLPESWLVHGTTGYDFAALATGWLVCGEHEDAHDAALSAVHRCTSDVRGSSRTRASAW